VLQTPDRHRRLRAVFDEALLREPSGRAAFVREACANDPDLMPDIMRLLAAHDDTRSFLDRQPWLPAAIQAEEDFPGTSRFWVLRRLGAGGMGAVYEVHDRDRDEIVALKTFLRTGAADLYRLKREFRSLADVTHPNLACLYELFVEDERCFFTMELVRGLNFVDYVRGADRTRRFQDRFIPALRQLVEGVAALHARGKLHRDIKPSNVLVTPEGRVVILDFGLITELMPLYAGVASDVKGGTPAYMAPEETSGGIPSEAGDWYGVGMTLYEALTGTIPFAGTLTELLISKRTIDPPAPVNVVPGVPAELSAVCMGLLCRDPAQRLSGPAALRELAREPGVPAVFARVRDSPFVGRAGQLHVLNEAFRTVLNGNAAAVSVSGPSGIGKSALIRQFLGQVAGTDILVLSGRCYENESVPFKALDGVIDDLSRHLTSIPQSDVETLLPPDVPALNRVFPVLLQVRAIAALRPDRTVGSADPFTVRRRAFSALRELLGRLANRRPLVVWIDDLQWADADSAVLLEDLLWPPAPAMLTLLSFRSEETAGKSFLRALLDRAGRDIWSAIALDPLTDDEARVLIGALVPADATLDEDGRRQLTREAAGSPFVLEQLARYAGLRIPESGQTPTFADMFAARLQSLSPDAQRLLETLALCGRPMASGVVCDASGVAAERQSLIATLRASRFIRSSGSSERIETYHDRIREALTANIAPDAAEQIHGRIVQVLVARGSDDCEALFEHYHGAGDQENAATQAALAGDKAGTALAFDRSAFFFHHALALAPASSQACRWREGLASALANAGRPTEAAAAYMQAAAGATGLQRVELQRRGAEQFLIGGYIDRGLNQIRTMLADLGMSVPGSPRAALLPLVWRRARLRWRGLHFTPRPAGQVDADTLLCVDACWSAATGLLLVDMISAVAISARHLLVALDAGEPYRLARAMALESMARAAYPSGRMLSRRLVEQSKELARSVGHPHAIGLSRLADAMIAISLGQWKSALTLSEDALAFLRDQCVGVTWELNMAQNVVIWALMYLGELGEVSRRVPPLIASARRSGNLYITTELCTRSNYVWLAADDPDEGERVAIESIGRWSHTGFHRQHYSAILARIQTALYRGDAALAWRLLDDLDRILRHSYLRRVQVMRIESEYLRGRGGLAMAARYGLRRRFRSAVRTASRRIASERMPWSDPIALLLEAGLAHLEGNAPRALRHLHDAAAGFDSADMKLYLAVTKRRIGALQDDAAGRALKGEADQWMAAQDIKNPAAMTRTLAPGFPDPS
jgi:eukaryotic-like serine/threonine-protein kinase